jgi:hypothetical protein
MPFTLAIISHDQVRVRPGCIPVRPRRRRDGTLDADLRFYEATKRADSFASIGVLKDQDDGYQYLEH